MRVKSSGSALLSALFIMTLIAIAATAMSTRLQLDIYRTRLVIESDKLVLASQVVGFWAMDSLSAKKINFKALNDAGKVLDFPGGLIKIYPDVTIKGELYDLQAKFNLNNLQNKQFETVFLNLLKQQLTGVDLNQEKQLLVATQSWIFPQQIGEGEDPWASYYTQQQPPYLSANQPMQSISEFRLVAGVTPNIYQTLLPMITALPTVTPINITTAPKSVLMALGTGLTESQALEFIQFRKSSDELSDENLRQLMMKFHIPANQVVTSSQYYLSVARVKGEDLNMAQFTIIQRVAERNKAANVRVLSETVNAT